MASENVMAASPLESSSTAPPHPNSTSSPISTANDPMDGNASQETRKRPRLDSGACESMSIEDDQSPAYYHLHHNEPHSTSSTASVPPPSSTSSTEPSAATPSRAANKVTINMKSPGSIPDTAAPEHRPDDPSTPPEHEQQSTNVELDSSAGISNSSSATAQSPEIEVAEVEDMDQDPASSNWRSLEDSLRDRSAPEVVQLDEPFIAMTDFFPKTSESSDIRESVEEIGAALEKGKKDVCRISLL